MTFIDPRTAREIYEKMMKDALYVEIEGDRELKRYVDELYQHLFYHEMFVSILVAAGIMLLFIYFIYPSVDPIIRGAMI